MIKVEDVEKVRRTYFREGVSIGEIGRTLHHSRRVIRRASESADPGEYRRVQERPAPVLGPWQEKIDGLWDESQKLPRKQRYTARKIYAALQQQGYAGSEVTISRYVGQKRQASRSKQVFLPLEFDPGEHAQADWGEAVVEMAGERVVVQLFIMRLNYSHARFVMAFPFQKQEAFFEGHIQAFRCFGAVPKRITYDNLKTAVFRILTGRNRIEQVAFVAFRSHYLFDSRYGTPGQGHEKGRVESDVGFAQRNFLVPLPKVDSYEELNAIVCETCRCHMDRRVRGGQETVAEKLAAEQPLMLAAPKTDYKAYREHLAPVNPYGLVPLDTNRYSVPGHVGEEVRLRAFAFRVEILGGEELIASHPRCFAQDGIQPVHYRMAMTQRPGAFEHAIPMRRWRAEWPPIYETLLAQLRLRWPGERGLREFLSILALHKAYPAERMVQALQAALALGAVHRDGVQLSLHQLSPEPALPIALDLCGHDRLVGIGEQPVNRGQYDLLLSGS